MSCQKGNASRSRPQKYKNRTSFKNNLYDNSQKTKLINSIEVNYVCERCKKKIEWKIRYKKYKMLKAPKKCTKCQQKTVKQSYHNICLPCAKEQEICTKCGQNKEIVKRQLREEEQIKLATESKAFLLVKAMPLRKRRAYLRLMSKIDALDEDRNEDETNSKRRKELLLKLNALAITEDNDNIDSTDDEGEDDDDIDSADDEDIDSTNDKGDDTFDNDVDESKSVLNKKNF